MSFPTGRDAFQDTLNEACEMDDDLTFIPCSGCGRLHGGSKLYCAFCNNHVGRQMGAEARERRGLSQEQDIQRISERMQRAIDEIKSANERYKTGDTCKR